MRLTAYGAAEPYSVRAVHTGGPLILQLVFGSHPFETPAVGGVNPVGDLHARHHTRKCPAKARWWMKFSLAFQEVGPGQNVFEENTAVALQP